MLINEKKSSLPIKIFFYAMAVALVLMGTLFLGKAFSSALF